MSVAQNSQPVSPTPRADIVRDLYAIAEYFLAHPEYPLPDMIDMHIELPDAAAVDRWAAAHGGRVILVGERLATSHAQVPGTSVRVTAHVAAQR